MLSDTEMMIRLTAAAALGSLIGFERERLLWAAGIRTHMLVCVGSCLIMLVSQYGFSNILTHQNIVLDPSRIAAQVVSGIGFLGAGSILARGEIVKGLTTAASIWTVAAIGLAVGGGLYLAAGASTVIILIILAGMKPLEEAYRSRNQTCMLKLEVENNALTPDLLRETLSLRIGQVKRFLVESRDPQGADRLAILLTKVSSQDIASFPDKLRDLDGVRQVTIEKRGSDSAANARA
jgi:putative Mg2+ transporter-C (MgtC) family protein